MVEGKYNTSMHSHGLGQGFGLGQGSKGHGQRGGVHWSDVAEVAGGAGGDGGVVGGG